MVTQVELLADIQIFLLELPGFSQVAVADFLGLTYAFSFAFSLYSDIMDCASTCPYDSLWAM